MDEPGRIATVSRTVTRAGGPVTLSASYLYDAAGRVVRIDYGNGTALVRVYDNADRPMRIQYLDAAANAYLTLDYTLTADGLVKRIVETDLVSNGQVEYGPTVGQGGVVPGPIVAQVDFEYDARNRLTRETRTVTGDFDTDLGRSEYDLSYTYDVGGNRLTKTDLLTGRVTAYVYDIETPDTIDNNQHNNRLLGYDVNDFNPADGTPIPVEQARYKYGPAGNVMLLVKQLDMDGDGAIDVNDLAAVWWFYYSSSNQLWLAVQGTGNFDEPTGALTATTFVKAAEYRYDGGRQRYLVRQRDPSANFAIIGTDQWRDYLGNNVYNDYTVDTAGTVTNGTGYLLNIGYDDPSLADSPAYIGRDLIGTTRRVSNSAPFNPDNPGVTGGPPAISRTVLTAFGEPISSADTGNTRYGYAGDSGYETTEQFSDPLAELGWLHVGERYYDPAVGRFVQRDPAGIWGGLNVYEYVRSTPTVAIDPNGLFGLGWQDQIRINGRFGPTRWMARFLRGPTRWGPLMGWGTLCIIAAQIAADRLDASNLRTEKFLKNGTPTPLPNAWAPWNWGIYSGRGWVRSPGRWIFG